MTGRTAGAAIFASTSAGGGGGSFSLAWAVFSSGTAGDAPRPKCTVDNMTNAKNAARELRMAGFQKRRSPGEFAEPTTAIIAAGFRSPGARSGQTADPI